MNRSYSHCSLFLCPEQHDYLVHDISELTAMLREIGFIDTVIDDGNNAFSTGDSFLNYIAYMGCAPAIQFEAGDDESNFCYVKIHDYDDAELLYSKKQLKPPLCPQRNHLVNDWQQQLSSTTIYCPRCETSIAIEKFNWRRMAGYARLFIEITDVFPKEAIPQTALMDELDRLTGTGWSYFYSCR